MEPLKKECGTCSNTQTIKKLRGYQDKSKGKVYPIVNAFTKAWINDTDLPVFLVMNYETLINNKEVK